MKYCEKYVGEECYNGYCPDLRYDNEYVELSQNHPDSLKCSECPYYKGCEGCMFFNQFNECEA